MYLLTVLSNIHVHWRVAPLTFMKMLKLIKPIMWLIIRYIQGFLSLRWWCDVDGKIQTDCIRIRCCKWKATCNFQSTNSTQQDKAWYFIILLEFDSIILPKIYTSGYKFTQSWSFSPKSYRNCDWQCGGVVESLGTIPYKTTKQISALKSKHHIKCVNNSAPWNCIKYQRPDISSTPMSMTLVPVSPVVTRFFPLFS